ncbi:MAG: DNA repair protein RecO [Tissierellaceae bacterium]|nr:DNA repair protein RecO [Tissierellaceae bacterium]
MLKTEGIVLKDTKYQETSKILIIYTKSLGKISVMAKGANRPKSKLIANSQPFSYNEFQFSQGRNFYYINAADIIDSFYDIRENMESMVYGFYILELVEKSVPDEEANDKIFLLLVKTLKILSELKDNYLRLIVAFELKYISFLGYRPYLNGCVMCGNGESSGYKFSNVEGGIICTNCYTKDLTAKILNSDVYDSMVKLLYAQLDELDNLNISDEILYRLHDILEGYILYNIDRKSFNSLNFFKSNKLKVD